MLKKSIYDRCNISTNKSDDRFVGIQFNNGDVSIRFPLGFNLEHDTEEELRKDILLLIQTIRNTITHRESEIGNNSGEFKNTMFPVTAYLNVLKDYFVRGYYKETEVHYKKGSHGKINWAKTIKTQCSRIQEEEAYYLDFVVRKNKANNNQMITLIHRYCVYESFQKIGWLFTSFIPPKPTIRYNLNVFRSVLKDKLYSTFNDRNKQLFASMLAIIEFQGDKDAPVAYMYGTNRFEYVWEKLIDRVYGIQNKRDFFPKTEWNIIGDGKYDSSSLEPDSIMFCNGNVYILDAKYYQYGRTLSPSDLPASASVNKQITYGEYVAKIREDNQKQYKIYNAFLIPFDALNDNWNKFANPLVVNIGEAVSQWKRSENEYEKIQGILIDTKHLMSITVRQDQTEIIKLADAMVGRTE